MSKVSVSSQATVFAGIDVSAATLAVAVQREDREGFEQREFANSAAGHKQLIEWLLKRGGRSGSRWKPLASTRWTWPWRWIGRKESRSRC